MADEEGEVQYSVHYLDGERETCDWVKRAGRARVSYANGDWFEGTYNSHGQRHGVGEYHYFVESEEEEQKLEGHYSGEWQQGRKHGIGTMKFPNGDEYRGMWRKDKRHGQGTYKYKSGDMYSGQWRDGQKHGRGTYRSASNQSELIGEWANGKLSRGKWALPDGSLYEGGFGPKGQPAGQGFFVFPHGALVEGTYVGKKTEEGEEEEEEEGEGAPKGPQWRTSAISASVVPVSELNRAPSLLGAFTPKREGLVGRVRVEEVVVANPGEGGAPGLVQDLPADAPAATWVVVMNVHTEPVNIRGLRVRPSDGAPTDFFHFAEDLELGPGARIRLLCGSAVSEPPLEELGIENVAWTAKQLWSLDSVAELYVEQAGGARDVLQQWGPDDREALARAREEEAARALAAGALKGDEGEDQEDEED